MQTLLNNLDNFSTELEILELLGEIHALRDHHLNFVAHRSTFEKQSLNAALAEVLPVLEVVCPVHIVDRHSLGQAVLLDLVGEKHFARGQLVDHTAQRPYVYFKRKIQSHDDFGSPVGPGLDVGVHGVVAGGAASIVDDFEALGRGGASH